MYTIQDSRTRISTVDSVFCLFCIKFSTTPYWYLWIFSLKFFHCLNCVVYQSIELGLLYKTVYTKFLFQLNIESKKLKYCIFRHCIEFGLSSILIKCPCHKTIVGKIITSRCSPFNSPSNHMLNINIKCSKVETIRLKLSLSRYRSLEKLVELCQRRGINSR